MSEISVFGPVEKDGGLKLQKKYSLELKRGEKGDITRVKYKSERKGEVEVEKDGEKTSIRVTGDDGFGFEHVDYGKSRIENRGEYLKKYADEIGWEEIREKYENGDKNIFGLDREDVEFLLKEKFPGEYGDEE